MLSALCGTAWADCKTQNPMGPRDVIECTAKELYNKTGPELWSDKLFSAAVSDKFCGEPQALLFGKTQVAMYDIGCKEQKGSYFAYDKFLQADEELKARLGDAYQFMRQGSYEVKLQELANFLATAAQETTKGEGKYQVDGLYFRYENGPLQSADPKWAKPPNPDPLGNCVDVPANPDYTGRNQMSKTTGCRNLAISEYKTEYYPLSTYAVAIKGGDNGMVYTGLVMDNDRKYDTATNTWTQPGKPSGLYPGGTYAPPSGYTWQYMNQIVEPAYWVGTGNLQLTEDSITKFFGWYHQKILNPAQQVANYPVFVKTFLNDGKLAWMGGLWFWNFRVKDKDSPALHALIAGSTKEACHDIGMTTFLVNGGCTDVWGRAQYYNYFKTEVFKLSGTAKTTPAGASSYVCTAELASYCTAP